MTNKVKLTQAEIEKDIIHAMKQPQNMSEADHRKLTVAAIVAACVLVVLEFVYPEKILWVWGVCALWVCLLAVFCWLRLKRRVSKVTFDDCEITVETVSAIAEESYVSAKSKRRHERIFNYTIRFESGKVWRIPKDNYPWCEERPMSDFAIYQSTHRGDTFTVVTKKETDAIATAYPTAFFEYRK